MRPEPRCCVRIERLTLGPYATNSYILTCPDTGDGLLVDAPAEGSAIMRAAKHTKATHILVTHSHADHIGALSELKSRLRVPVAIHRLDMKALSVKPEILLEDGQEVAFGKARLKVIHTPGHTPGSLCFLVGKHLLSGDTLFPHGPGRTNTPADLTRIIGSITGRLFVLSDDTEVYPGHGNSTILAKEKEEFAVFSARSHDPGLSGDVLWLSS
jgi:glyoxylase-like metal-dependent hydrolase (beta-lactamase superfamily II)